MSVTSLWVSEEAFFWISCLEEVKELLTHNHIELDVFYPSLAQSFGMFWVMHLAGSAPQSHGF